MEDFRLRKGLIVILVSLVVVVSFAPLASAKEKKPLASAEEMELLLFQEIPVVVTAARYEQKITEAPATIDVITAEQIKNLGVRTIAEALRFLPGIDIRNAGTKVYLAPRGLVGVSPGGTNRVLCLVDGRPINTPNHGSFFPDLTLPLTNVKRIEVIRGPGSALYGANAFAGVINIITKSPEDVDGVEVSVSGGTFSTQHHELLWGKEKHGIGGLLTARWYDSKGPRLIAHNSDFNDYNFYGKLKISNLTVSVGHHQTDRGLPGKLTRPTPLYREKIEESFVDILGNIEFSPQANLMLRGYINDREDKAWMATEAAIDEVVRGIEVLHNWQISSKHKLISGVDVRWENADSAALKGDHSTRNIAFYLEDEFKPIDKLTFTVGTRYDDHSVYGSVVSPRCSAVYLLPNTTVKISYGEAFRAPTFAELYTDMWHGPTMHMIGNKNLQPEKIKVYEIGLTHMFDKSLEGELNLFYNKAEDLITMRSTLIGGMPPVTQYDNVNRDKAEIKGFEIALKKRFTPALSGFVNYSYEEAEDKITGEDLEYVPENKFSFGLNLKLKDRFILNAAAYYVDERRYSGGKLGDYMVTNVKLIGKLKQDLELSLAVYNLFDRDYQETEDYPMPGREWILGLRYRF